MANSLPRYSHGIAFGMILLVIALIAAVVAAVSLSMSGTSKNLSEFESRAYAMSVVRVAKNWKDRFDEQLLLGNAPYDVYYNAWVKAPIIATRNATKKSWGLPHANALISPTFVNSIYLDRWVDPVLGTPAGYEYYVEIPHIKKEVCQLINNIVVGYDKNAEPIDGDSFPPGALELCYKIGSAYYYYYVISIN